MPPRWSGRTSPHKSSLKGKGKERATNTEDTSRSGHSGSNESQSATKLGQSTNWSVQDEEFFLKSISASKAMMGDDQMFRPTFWTNMANEFPPPVQGAVKMDKSCKAKWKRVRDSFLTSFSF